MFVIGRAVVGHPEAVGNAVDTTSGANTGSIDGNVNIGTISYAVAEVNANPVTSAEVSKDIHNRRRHTASEGSRAGNAYCYVAERAVVKYESKVSRRRECRSQSCRPH